MMLTFDAEAVNRLEDSIRLRMFRRLAFMRFERVEHRVRAQRLAAAAEPLCGARLDCGSQCILERGHSRACECAGDEPWQPGSCPA